MIRYSVVFIRNVIRSFFRPFKMKSFCGRWRIFRCQALGVGLLCLQFVLLTFLLYSFLPSNSATHSILLEDAYDVSFTFTTFGAPLFVVGNEILKKGGATRVGWKDKAPFAIEVEHIGQVESVSTKLKEAGFESIVFYNRIVTKFPPRRKTVPVGLAIRKKYPFYIMFLYSRIDNFWWHGAILKDPDAQDKLKSIGLTLEDLSTVHKEGVFRKTELAKGTLGGLPMVMPRHVKFWLNSTDSTYEFIECNYEQAYTFLKAHGRNFDDTNRFQHKAWKILSKTQVIMDRLGIPFWLSSGTCLGFHRECGIIPHTTDVDIGIFAKYYSENIVKEFLFRGFYLKHIFGKVNDSYELSFVSGGVKLDIFFFYEEGNTMWNGGTQRSTGKKFKYVFPRFDLCWTEFLDLLVRIPCDTTSYIEANYGPDWAEPKREWNWHKSPPNVRDNGVWPREELPDVVQVFHAPEYPFT